MNVKSRTRLYRYRDVNLLESPNPEGLESPGSTAFAPGATLASEMDLQFGGILPAAGQAPSLVR